MCVHCTISKGITSYNIPDLVSFKRIAEWLLLNENVIVKDLFFYSFNQSIATSRQPGIQRQMDSIQPLTLEREKKKPRSNKRLSVENCLLRKVEAGVNVPARSRSRLDFFIFLLLLGRVSGMNLSLESFDGITPECTHLYHLQL